MSDWLLPGWPSGQPVLDIPPFTWAVYSRYEWYSWGDGIDYFVIYIHNAWRWYFHSMQDVGDLMVTCDDVTEGRGYPDAETAMRACDAYRRRTGPERSAGVAPGDSASGE